MQSERFKKLLDELDGNSLQTLKEKNARYAQNGDCLHNFRSGADIAGGTPAQACWGYLTKHLVALRDKVEKNDFSNREDFLEKCQDTINYIRFLWCIGNDENTKLVCRDNLGRAVDPDTANLHEMVDKMGSTMYVYRTTDHELFRICSNATVETAPDRSGFIIHTPKDEPVFYPTSNYRYEIIN